MGHALLTQLLMPTLLRTAEAPGADVRVVVLSSKAHSVFAPKGGIAWETLKSKAESVGGLTLYGQSKLANLLFAKGLAERYPQLTAVAVHPGTVKSDIWGKAGAASAIVSAFFSVVVWLTAVTSEVGAWTQLWAATGKGVTSGKYYEPVGLVDQESKLARDEGLINEMWDWTSKELESHGGSAWPSAKL